MTTPHPMLQLVQRCDRAGNVVGTMDRREAHTAPGARHLAVMVVVRDTEGRLLLQRRRHRLWDGRYDLGCATHVLARGGAGDGHVPETPDQAAARCLRVEWTLEATPVREGAFSYDAFDVGGVEREHCVVFGVTDDGGGRPVAAHAYGRRWIDPAALEREVAERPRLFTPWTRRALACADGA